jgi:hypothetical protein
VRHDCLGAWNYVRGGVELRQGRRQKTRKNLKEKTKNFNLLLLNSNSNLSFSLTNYLTNNFNASDFYFLLLQLLTTDSVFLKNI